MRAEGTFSMRSGRPMEGLTEMEACAKSRPWGFNTFTGNELRRSSDDRSVHMLIKSQRCSLGMEHGYWVVPSSKLLGNRVSVSADQDRQL